MNSRNRRQRMAGGAGDRIHGDAKESVLADDGAAIIDQVNGGAEWTPVRWDTVQTCAAPSAQAVCSEREPSGHATGAIACRLRGVPRDRSYTKVLMTYGSHDSDLSREALAPPTGASTTAQPEAALPIGGLSVAQQRDMAELSIRYNGRRYDYNGYRYDVLADAVAYARLQAARGATAAQSAHAYAPERPLAPPTSAEQQLMARLSITYDPTGYRHDGFRYELLSDAVHYAERVERRRLSALAGPQSGR